MQGKHRAFARNAGRGDDVSRSRGRSGERKRDGELGKALGVTDFAEARFGHGIVFELAVVTTRELACCCFHFALLFYPKAPHREIEERSTFGLLLLCL